MPENHSQHEANKALRVLEGKRLKFTIRVHHPNGKVTEWQGDRTPKLEYSTDTRSIWLMQSGSDYNNAPIMPWQDGMILLVEENPKA